MPSVEIEYRLNSMAFKFQYSNRNYFLTVEKNELKVNAITQYIHINTFQRQMIFFFSSSTLFILCFILGNVHCFFLFLFFFS